MKSVTKLLALALLGSAALQPVLADDFPRLANEPAAAFMARVQATQRVRPELFPGLNALLLCYPEACAGLDFMPDGRVGLILTGNKATRIFYDDGVARSPEQILDNPDPEDTVRMTYPRGLAGIQRWPESGDPGRARCLEFFQHVYGADEKAVRANLVHVPFLGKKTPFNKQNGAAEALRRAGVELQDLLQRRPELQKYAANMGGTFAWRQVAKTTRLSAHSFGIAIDFNSDLGGYWEWEKSADKGDMKRRLAYPQELVAIMEKHGFIWGGKWYHFDLMHFEYRPELIMLSQGGQASVSPAASSAVASTPDGGPKLLPASLTPPAVVSAEPSGSPSPSVPAPSFPGATLPAKAPGAPANAMPGAADTVNSGPQYMFTTAAGGHILLAYHQPADRENPFLLVEMLNPQAVREVVKVVEILGLLPAAKSCKISEAAAAAVEASYAEWARVHLPVTERVALHTLALRLSAEPAHHAHYQQIVDLLAKGLPVATATPSGGASR